jgi:peptidyl-prolyl cis-trans isomerase SurA
MRRTLLLLAALMLLPPAAAAQRIVLVDRIVAVVNKEVITLSELQEAVAGAQRQLKRQGTQQPDRDLLERQVLERLILDKAQLQFARDSGIRIDEVQLDRALQRIAEENKLTLADFRKTLERDGIPFDAFREDVREQIMLSRLREREVDDRIQVSDTEVELFLEEVGGATGARDEVQVQHVLVRLPDQANAAATDSARAKAEKARAEAAAGGDFGRIAASYSDAPDAMQAGSLGWRTPDRLPELFAAAVAKMKPGAVSEVLRSSAGFHVIKLVDRRGVAPAGPPISQTRLRHILIRTSEQVSEGEARRRLAGLRERLVSGAADFAQLARANSDDPSAARGGDLDWIYPGDTVPEFERAYQDLAVGEVSQPVRTPFGFHLIQVQERRSADVSPERRRLQARMAIRERKSDEAFQQWLRQLRDQTYVELRLEER